MNVDAEGAVPREDRLASIARDLEHAAHLLPAQGPISVFIHHNTLHAFESQSFEEAVAAAGELFGCEPYLSEATYRDELARGRITADDLAAVLARDLGDAGDRAIAGLCGRGELRRASLEHGISAPDEAALAWILAESDALTRLRRDLPEATRRRWLDRGRAIYGRDRSTAAIERALVRELHDACLRGARRAPAPSVTASRPLRPRDRLLAARGIDSDALVHPTLIRLAGAYLDQGIAYWPMPGRERGLLRASLDLLGPEGAAAAADPELAARLPGALAALERGGALASIAASLDELGIDDGDQEPFLRETLLALRGWAGLFRQLEERPDRAPVHAHPATLADFVALRLLLERAALARLTRAHLGQAGSLRERLAALPEAPARAPSPAHRAFALFQRAQILGIEASALDDLDPAAVAELFAEIEGFDAVERRRLLHLAYERRYRLEILDAIALHAAAPVGAPAPAEPSFQAVFCIDEREESLRRHLEEIEPSCETLGAAGFFGVAMYYRGIEDAHPVPLCPIVIRPRHEVEEIAVGDEAERARARARSVRVVGRLRRGFDVGTRTFARGTLLTALTGVAAVVPMVLRVLFPRLAGRLRRRSRDVLWRGPSRTRLALDRRDDAHPHLGEVMGFTKDEMAAIVRRLLEDLGIAGRLAPLVIVLGHGSVSLNNPHESAHDCGACGGGRGGPNARALAQMANDPAVRDRLAQEGLEIPATTWFVGGIHNTCDDAVILFDTDLIPEATQPLVERARRALDEARTRDAHERCRRFDAAPSWLPPTLALAHVEGRAEDLAQVRPEYGHATNAICVVGRRARTRGLFLDRRAFLVSYDPSGDDEGAILARILGAALPVCAGINLEYYFSRVDPVGYGAGTKLPHNITGLLGVMDGHQSDLRTGLPWQMVEIHEPVRLLVIVDAPLQRLRAVLDANPALRQLVEGRWVQIAALDPGGPEIDLLAAGAALRHRPTSATLARAPSSVAWYRGRRDHLPCAQISGAAPGGAEEARR
ncbi:MAG: DUF2309 domain-containing protein [Myxococcales bacterium]|nr:DUF2309 domain-containing protein [Myxococcales bacterium]